MTEETIRKIAYIATNHKVTLKERTKEILLLICENEVKLKKVITIINSELVSKREKELLHYVSEGLTAKIIADKMCISTRTAEQHRYKLMRKLNVQNTAQLITIAHKYKLI